MKQSIQQPLTGAYQAQQYKMTLHMQSKSINDSTYQLFKVAALVAVPHGCQLGSRLSSSLFLLGALTTCSSSNNIECVSAP
jgi:uncharacterized membrane protein YgdD (TMEM256/DUF423 family)